MPLESRQMERIVGLFVIALLVVCTSLVFMLLRQRDWFSKKFEVRVVFGKGMSITEGTPIKMEGIPIGVVKSLRFNTQNQMEGVLSINMRYHPQVRKDSVATIIRSHLLASPEVDVSAGSPDVPMLMSGDSLRGVATMEVSMKDFMNLANNAAVVVRDLSDPKGSFQRTLRNMETITDRIAAGDGSMASMLKDDGKMFSDSREILGGLNTMIRGKDSLPITLTEQSQLTLRLEEKLDKQTDALVAIAQKFDKVADHLLAKDNMAGALFSDPELFQQMKQFFMESRGLLLDLRQLAVNMRAVVPELPGLIQEAKQDLKDTGRVLRSIQRLPFVGSVQEPTPKPETLHAPARLEGAQEGK